MASDGQSESRVDRGMFRTPIAGLVLVLLLLVSTVILFQIL